MCLKKIVHSNYEYMAQRPNLNNLETSTPDDSPKQF